MNGSAALKFRPILGLILYLFFAGISFGQQVNDRESFFNYTYDKGIIKINKVKTVTVRSFYQNEKSSNNTTYYFDNEGLLTRVVASDSNNRVLSEWHFKTNSYGDLISKNEINYESGRRDTIQYFKTYEGNKLIIDSVYENFITTHFEYNKNGDLAKKSVIISFGHGNSAMMETLYEYGPSGKTINIIETAYADQNDSKGTIFSSRAIHYGTNGKIQREVERINNENVLMPNSGSIDYVYDDNGNLIQISRTDDASFYYTYNERGLVTSKKTKLRIERDRILITDTDLMILDKYYYTYRK